MPRGREKPLPSFLSIIFDFLFILVLLVLLLIGSPTKVYKRQWSSSIFIFLLAQRGVPPHHNNADRMIFLIEYGNDEELPEVKCQAHPTVVPVGNPYGAISYEPSYVKVKRCIGKALPRTKCAPVKHRYHYRNVKVQKFIGDKHVATCVVPIREDLRCQFSCIKSQRDCKSGEIFDSSRCACKSG